MSGPKSIKLEDYLPPIIELNDFNGNWTDYENHLYEIFLRDFYDSKPFLFDKPVNYRRNPEIEGKLQSFFHVTSVGSSLAKDPNDRNPDLRRCERLEWIRIIINDYQNQNGCYSKIKCWPEKWRNYTRWHLLLEEVKFLVVVEERETYNLLVTSYYLSKDHQVKKKVKKYEKYIRQKTPL